MLISFQILCHDFFYFFIPSGPRYGVRTRDLMSEIIIVIYFVTAVLRKKQTLMHNLVKEGMLRMACVISARPGCPLCRVNSSIHAYGLSTTRKIREASNPSWSTCDCSTILHKMPATLLDYSTTSKRMISCCVGLQIIVFLTNSLNFVKLQ